jgi:hypothetical protein
MTHRFCLFLITGFLLLLSSNLWSIGLIGNTNKKSKTEYLTRRVIRNAGTEEEKVRAIYLWITDHIKYDVKRYIKPNAKYYNTTQTLRRRKAICTEYADLFAEMCKYAGISAIKVEGFAKDWFYEKDDLVFSSNHAWNIAFVNGKWCLYDLTFASGYLGLKPYMYEKMRPPSTLYLFPVVTKSKMVFQKKRNDRYYDTPPEIFIEDHLPDVSMFQLLTSNLTVEDFEMNYKTSSQTNTNEFNSQIEYLNKNTIDYGMIWMGDSASSFNCKNKSTQVHLYFMAANHQLNGQDENTKSRAYELIDTAIKMVGEASALISEDYRYRLRKNTYRNQLMGSDYRSLKSWSSRRAGFWLSRYLYASNGLKPIDKYILITNNRKGKYNSWYNQLRNVKQIKDTSHLHEIIRENNEILGVIKNEIAIYTDSLIKDAVSDTIDLYGLKSNILSQVHVMDEVLRYTNEIKQYRAEHFDQLDTVLMLITKKRNLLKIKSDSLFDGLTAKVKNERLSTSRFKTRNRKLSELVNIYMFYQIENAKRGVYNEKEFNAYLDTIMNNCDVLNERYYDYKLFLVFQKKAAKDLYYDYKFLNYQLRCERIYEKHRFNYKQRYLSLKRRSDIKEIIHAKITNNTLKRRLNSRK